MVAARSDVLNPRLSADDIRMWDPPHRFGRIDPDELRQFLDRVAGEVAMLTEERLNAQRFPAAETAAQQATHILVSARRTAEEQLRGAQAQAREMSMAGQQHFDELVAGGQAQAEEIIVRAHGQAEAIIAEAAARFPVDAQAQIAFLDSFSDLIAAQLTHAVEVIRSRKPARPGSDADSVPA